MACLTVLALRWYDSWGKVLSTTGSMAGTLGAIQPFRYRGYVYDEETGLYYLRSRYYNPSIGRFLNADNRILINLYRYCKNTPVLLIDPVGMSTLEEEEECSFYTVPEWYSNYVVVQKVHIFANADNYVVIMNNNAKLYDATDEEIGTVKPGSKLIATKIQKGSGYSTYYGLQYGYIHPDEFEIDRIAENWEVEYGLTDWRRSDYGSEYVKRIQTDIGVYPDGVYGEKTERRIVQIQVKNGLYPDGIVGEKTKKLLLTSYNEIQ